MSSIASALPSNRVASLATFIAGLAGLGTSLAGVWPNSTTNEIAQILGGIGALSGPLSHVVGSWLWDRTPAGQAAANAKLASNLPFATGSDTDVNLNGVKNDTIPPESLPIQDNPWLDSDPQMPESSIDSEQFDEPTSNSGDGSDSTVNPYSSEFGGPPNADFAPEHNLHPEPDTTTSESALDTGPDVQKSGGEQA